MINKTSIIFCLKDIIKRMKIKPQSRKKVSKHISDKYFISVIYKDSQNPI
jgi:hypothetical protein